MEKSQERGVIIFLIALIFVFSFIVGYSIYSRAPKEIDYEGVTGSFVFTLDKSQGERGDYILKLPITFANGVYREYNIPFDYGPEELKDIEIGENVKDEIFPEDVDNWPKRIYITRDPDLDIKTKDELIVAMLTVERIVGQKMLSPPLYNIPTLLASTVDNARAKELDLPIVGCYKVADNNLVIWFKEGSENKIYKETENCVVAEFKEGDDPIKVSTALTYNILGVL